jgi:hypothetical protein
MSADLIQRQFRWSGTLNLTDNDAFDFIIVLIFYDSNLIQWYACCFLKKCYCATRAEQSCPLFKFFHQIDCHTSASIKVWLLGEEKAAAFNFFFFLKKKKKQQLANNGVWTRKKYA